ncbi:hypothetical protein CCUS01_02689 [Colletotrichum cuscutae]|uniref:Uncharacterized protein n=1 Tax=Colletotrichum cuscutae TaxID=1209917 RepID=A0AAI9YBW0_9PEZI|nr:hypothetical protein CCUS01_02689 [Colletotrichum cuscutae]
MSCRTAALECFLACDPVLVGQACVSRRSRLTGRLPGMRRRGFTHSLSIFRLEAIKHVEPFLVLKAMMVSETRRQGMTAISKRDLSMTAAFRIKELRRCSQGDASKAVIKVYTRGKVPHSFDVLLVSIESLAFDASNYSMLSGPSSCPDPSTSFDNGQSSYISGKNIYINSRKLASMLQSSGRVNEVSNALVMKLGRSNSLYHGINPYSIRPSSSLTLYRSAKNLGLKGMMSIVAKPTLISGLLETTDNRTNLRHSHNMLLMWKVHDQHPSYTTPCHSLETVVTTMVLLEPNHYITLTQISLSHNKNRSSPVLNTISHEYITFFQLLPFGRANGSKESTSRYLHKLEFHSNYSRRLTMGKESSVNSILFSLKKRYSPDYQEKGTQRPNLNSPCPQRCSIALKAKHFQHPGAVVSPKANQTSTSVNATTRTNGQATHKPNSRRPQNPPLDKSTASSRSLTNVNKLRIFRRPTQVRLPPIAIGNLKRGKSIASKDERRMTSQSSPWAQNPLMARHTLTIRPYRKSFPTNEVKIPTLHLELSKGLLTQQAFPEQALFALGSPRILLRRCRNSSSTDSQPSRETPKRPLGLLVRSPARFLATGCVVLWFPAIAPIPRQFLRYGSFVYSDDAKVNMKTLDLLSSNNRRDGREGPSSRYSLDSDQANGNAETPVYLNRPLVAGSLAATIGEGTGATASEDPGDRRLVTRYPCCVVFGVSETILASPPQTRDHREQATEANGLINCNRKPRSVGTEPPETRFAGLDDGMGFCRFCMLYLSAPPKTPAAVSLRQQLGLDLAAYDAAAIATHLRIPGLGSVQFRRGQRIILLWYGRSWLLELQIPVFDAAFDLAGRLYRPDTAPLWLSKAMLLFSSSRLLAWRHADFDGKLVEYHLLAFLLDIIIVYAAHYPRLVIFLASVGSETLAARCGGNVRGRPKSQDEISSLTKTHDAKTFGRGVKVDDWGKWTFRDQSFGDWPKLDRAPSCPETPDEENSNTPLPIVRIWALNETISNSSLPWNKGLEDGLEHFQMSSITRLPYRADSHPQLTLRATGRRRATEYNNWENSSNPSEASRVLTTPSMNPNSTYEQALFAAKFATTSPRVALRTERVGPESREQINLVPQSPSSRFSNILYDRWHENLVSVHTISRDEAPRQSGDVAKQAPGIGGRRGRSTGRKPVLSDSVKLTTLVNQAVLNFFRHEQRQVLYREADTKPQRGLVELGKRLWGGQGLGLSG